MNRSSDSWLKRGQKSERTKRRKNQRSRRPKSPRISLKALNLKKSSTCLLIVAGNTRNTTRVIQTILAREQALRLVTWTEKLRKGNSLVKGQAQSNTRRNIRLTIFMSLRKRSRSSTPKMKIKMTIVSHIGNHLSNRSINTWNKRLKEDLKVNIKWISLMKRIQVNRKSIWTSWGPLEWLSSSWQTTIPLWLEKKMWIKIIKCASCLSLRSY